MNTGRGRTTRRFPSSAWWIIGGFVLCACQPAERALPIDRPTQVGQRLWFVALRVPGRLPRDLDSQVAIPLLRALQRDPLCEVVGSLSRPGALVVFLRSDVAVSSVRVVERSLGQVRLPDGSQRPAFGAAGPPGQALRALRQADALGWIDVGMGAGDLLGWLAVHPDRLRPTVPTPKAGFECAIRVEARTPDELARRMANGLGDPAVSRAPEPEAILRLDTDRVAAYLLFSGARAQPECARAQARIPDATCKALIGMPDGERALLGWPTPAF